MNFVPEEIHYEQVRSTYWTRIYVTDDNGKKGRVLVCAGRNYLHDFFRIPGGDQLIKDHFDKWLEQVISDLKKNIEHFKTDGQVSYKVYSFTLKGQQNALKFLKEEVTP